MADSNIAGLPAGAAIADTDLIAGSDAGSGTLVKKTGLQFNTYIRQMLANLPTTDPHVNGALWNNGGVISISFPFVRSLAGDTGTYALTGSTATLLVSGVPVFQVDFTGISVLPAQVTLTRASTGTYFDSSGVLQSAAIDAARFDHNPASPFVAKGLLIEEQRTNLFLTSAVPANQTITVVNSTTYTVSFYGTGSLTLSGAVSHTVTGSSATVLTSYTFTSATTSLVIAVAGSVVYPNVEAGSFATSHIPTTGASATRNADVVQLVGTALTALQATDWTLIAEFTDTQPAFYQSYIGAFAPGGANATTIVSQNANATNQVRSNDDDTNNNNLIATLGSDSTAGPVRVALGRSAAGRSLASNGGTFATDANPTTITFTQINLGAGELGNGPINGHFGKMAIYNSRLADATIQSKSVVGAAF